MKPCFAYLRVSGKSQIEGDGFDRQLLACENYATTHDLEIIRVFREEGVCGATELDGRPALQEMIAALLSNGTRVFLIERLDRLARALIVQETILQDMKRRGIQIISAAEPDLCDDDPSRTMIRQILGAFFEYERKMIVAKLTAAKKRIRASKGRCEGVKPYGSITTEVPILEKILEFDRVGVSSDKIAAHLNESGIKSRQGKPWKGNVIRKILRRGTLQQRANLFRSILNSRNN